MANWLTPKLNWLAGDAPTPADFNRIEGNTQYLNDLLSGVPIDLNVPVSLDGNVSRFWPTAPTRVGYLSDFARIGNRQVITKASIRATKTYGNDHLYAYLRVKRADGTWWQSPTVATGREADSVGSAEWTINLPEALGTPVQVELWAWSNYDDNQGTVSASLAYTAYVL